MYFYPLTLQICCCNSIFLKGLKPGIYILLWTPWAEYVQLSSKPRETQACLCENNMKHLARMLCFLYKILVGLVHSLSPEKNLTENIHEINDLRNSWRHCGLMAVAIIWCFSALGQKWVRNIETKKRCWINTKIKILQNASDCNCAILSNVCSF